MKHSTIGTVIDTSYLEYSMYVLENRAIPSCIDGLKPVHRKIIYAMLNEHKGKKTKVSDLGGISKFGYHHGEGSAMGSAITLAAPWNNNVALLQAHGNFGSRLITDAAAPRYIFASLGQDFYKYFSDFEVCDARRDEDNPEPQTYLPWIPWVLVNGIEGIAVGFACKFAPHDPKLLAKACIEYLSGKKINPSNLMPSWSSFKGQVLPDEAGDTTKCKMIGTIDRPKRNTWVISEVPFGVDRETYFNHLVKMEDEGKIEDFEDGCNDTGFRFTVKLNSIQDTSCAKDPVAFFKLSKIYSENYTTLDETGKLKLFTNKSDIVSYFCDYRLKKIEEKIQYDLKIAQQKLAFTNAKIRFIIDVLNQKIDLRNLKKADLADLIESEYITNGSASDVTRLISVPMYSMTKDAVVELQQLKKSLEDEILRLDELDAKDMFIAKLKTLTK